LLAFAGDLDIYAMDGFRTALAAVPAKPVIVDLSGVTYIEAATIGELMRLRNRLHAAGQPLAVVAPTNSRPYRVLAMTQTLELLHVRPTVEAATAFTAAPAKP
jgi:anti-anti-sigma factor